MSPYPLFGYLWPLAAFLLYACTPRTIRRIAGRWLRILGFAIGLLLLLPYLLS